ncbi:NF-kappa-B inhibitor epsilon isoform X2 [Rhincodon typus]|uniref:NF-kappa-B inhibitor epsilon isoform X2 n=1 Tax=Rhincodon typus TaxID=259920 RepID=UPI002030894D|nr:NF-kappa-B inhibitor epsilon isoform X2 [Rhincodon typus]
MEPVSWRSDPVFPLFGDKCGSDAERLDSSYGSESLSGRLESASYQLQEVEVAQPEGQGSEGEGSEGQGSETQRPEGQGSGLLGTESDPKAYNEQDSTERLDSSYGSQSLTESLSEALEHSCKLEMSGDLAAQTEARLNPYTFLGEDGDSIVHLAIIHKAEDYALHFISYFTVEMLDIQNDLFQSALHLAVYTEQLNIVQELLRKGVNMNQQDWNGNTPLHLACQHQLLDCVRLLTSNRTGKKLNMELQNWQGRTCLHTATLTRNQKILAMLLQTGSNINSQDGPSGKTSLHLSVECGDCALVRFLLRMGASVNATMYNGCTALHLAVGRWDTQIADILCQAGADPLLPNVEGDTAQDLASGNVDILALFPFDDIKLMGRPVRCSDF